MDGKLIKIEMETGFSYGESDVPKMSVWQTLYKRNRRNCIKKYFLMRNSLRNYIWPSSLEHLLFGCILSIYLLQVKPIYLYNINILMENLCSYFPMPEGTPPILHHIIFSTVTSAIVFLAVAKLRQCIIRQLHSYKGWLKNSRRPTLRTKIWGFFVKILSAGPQPSLYCLQNCLPKLPIPSLKETLDKLMESLEPICTPEELIHFKEEKEIFQRSVGPKLQLLLQWKSIWSPNYIHELMKKYIYLNDRSPLMCVSNFYVMDHWKWNPTTRQASRAANVLHSILSMKRKIDREELDPFMLQGIIPVCMEQYRRLFSAARLPGEDMDEIAQYDSSESRFVIVSCEGILYYLPVYDEANQIISPSNLEMLFQDIIEDAHFQTECVNDLEKCVPALTALPRDEWATIYKKHFKDGLNAYTMELIKKSICMVILSSKEYPELSERGKILQHGDGKTIWFDKCFTLTFFPDGKCGLNMEHSLADAVVMAHIWEYAMIMEIIESRYLDKGYVMPSVEEFKQKPFERPYKLSWNIGNELAKEIENAVIFSEKNCSDLHLVISNFNSFGKSTIKKFNVSPDAFIQIAFQLAYYRHANKFGLTTEATSTRLFLQGRYDDIRSCTKDCSSFVRSFVKGEASKSELLYLFHKAAETHKNLSDAVVSGRGTDRHILSLYITSKTLKTPNKFLEKILNLPIPLSTSQQPQRQLQTPVPDINNSHFEKKVSPGGAFYPLCDDGYALSYMLPTKTSIFFHVGSRRSSPVTDSQLFVDSIFNSMEDLRNLLEYNTINDR